MRYLAHIREKGLNLYNIPRSPLRTKSQVYSEDLDSPIPTNIPRYQHAEVPPPRCDHRSRNCLNYPRHWIGRAGFVE